MSCIYSDNNGKCTLYDDVEDVGTTYKTCAMGWDENGICCVEDDPDPGYSCESYEGIDYE